MLSCPDLYFKPMKIKPGSVTELMTIGIKPRLAKLIQGSSCKETGRQGDNWTQVEFPGKLIGWKEPFVLCVPTATLEF